MNPLNTDLLKKIEGFAAELEEQKIAYVIVAYDEKSNSLTRCNGTINKDSITGIMTGLDQAVYTLTNGNAGIMIPINLAKSMKKDLE
jgi:hypothetical protein